MRSDDGDFKSPKRHRRQDTNINRPCHSAAKRLRNIIFDEHMIDLKGLKNHLFFFLHILKINMTQFNLGIKNCQLV